MKTRFGLVCLGLLAGCTVGPDYRAPPVLTGSAPPPKLLGTSEPGFDGVAPLPNDWWRLYADPTLDGLIAKALIHNADLRSAAANLAVARAQLREIDAQRLQTGLTAVATHGDSSIQTQGLSLSSSGVTLYDVTEEVVYDVDLFGKLRRQTESARDNIEAQQAALDLARVNVAASTAQAYSQACTAGMMTAITERSVDVAQRTLDIVQRRYAAGLSASDDVVRARAQLSQTRSSLPLYEAEHRSALFMLATLTGDYPENIPAAALKCASPPVLTRPIPVGDGAKLLARRPDIRQAERQLAGAVADIGVSTAALYPSISIGGSVGDTRTRVGTTTASIFSHTVGSLISWNFPNFGGARAQIAAAKGNAKSALAAFDGKVLVALRETETALTRLARQLDTYKDLAATRTDDATAYADTLRKYEGGVGQFDAVLDAERTLIQADTALASSSSQISADQLALFMALGGGWENAPAPAATSLAPVIASDAEDKQTPANKE